MKQLLTAVFISLLTVTASAGLGMWQLTSEEHHVALDNESFMVLQANFPQHFSDVDSTSVSSATLDLFNYTFVGPTICAPNDPRLSAQTIAKSLCFVGENSNCMGVISALPAPVDPCL